MIASEQERKTYCVRSAQLMDLGQLVALYNQYAKELLNIETTATAEVFERDGFGNRFSMIIAQQQSPDRIVGFAAWQNAYDLHWGISGGQILDLYVEPRYRGLGLAPRMMSLVAREIREKGGSFLSGQGIVNATHPERLYQKIAIGVPGVDCILGGKAFRTFSELKYENMREFIRGLPLKEWNYLP